ncbi:MAG: fumarylacetoacetate hydrolase family protein [Thermoleophilaceae bacterium]
MSTAADEFAIARALFNAFEQGTSVEPPTISNPGLDVAAAYAIQRQVTALHRDAGRTVVGRKIGLTSEAIQRQLGVDSPDYGVILDSHVFTNGAVLGRSRGRMVAPRIEAELAVVLHSELSGPGLTTVEVLGALRAIVPVFELIDSRVADWRIALEDTIADNASCYGVVRGSEVDPADARDLRSVTVSISRDGDEVAAGRGEAVLGHPGAAVAWLGNELSRFGQSLPAGELILSGSFTAAVDALPGAYCAKFSEPIPPVRATIES